MVEDEADFERAEELGFDLVERRIVEALRFERRTVDVRRALERVGALGEGFDRRDLLVAVAEAAQRRLNGLVNDLEVSAAGEFLEFHQREVRLDAGCIAVHYETDRAGGRDAGGLGVAVASDLPGIASALSHLTRARAHVSCVNSDGACA